MATWTNATVTSKGNALQSKLLSTDKLIITRVVSGSGRAAAGQLVNQTAISNIQQTLDVETLTYDDNGNAMLNVLLSNEDLATSYICNQIGIYATDPDEGEILFAIAQEATTGQSIPSISEQPAGYNCGWRFSFTFSNTTDIDVTIDPSNALTLESADARYLKMTEAGNIYLSQFDAENTYLSQYNAESTYVRKDSSVGRTKTGEIVSLPGSLDDDLVEIAEGAEIFNDYEVAFDETMENLAQGNIATGKYSTARGTKNIVTSEGGSVSGVGNTTTGYAADNTGGGNNKVGSNYSGNYVGRDNEISSSGNNSANIAGHNNKINVPYGVNLGGNGNTVLANGGVNLGGIGLQAYRLQAIVGRYNDVSTTLKKGPTSETTTVGSLFMVGTGKSDTERSNGFRVQANGASYGTSAFNSSGADTAYLREWLDGNPNNEDRIGYFVVFDGEKIRKATADDDDILGVVSAPDIASFIANNYADNWQGRWLKDVFGRRLLEAVQVEAYTDEDGEEHPARTDYQFIENPEYDSKQVYIPREERPEWDVISIIGENVIIDDGTCQVNGYAKPNNDGIGTAAEGKTEFRVMKRIDENHVLVFHK